MLKNSLTLSSFVWKRLAEEYPDGKLPSPPPDDKVAKYVDEYYTLFRRYTSEGLTPHDAAVMVNQRSLPIYYHNWAIFGGAMITPDDVPFDLEGEDFAAEQGFPTDRVTSAVMGERVGTIVIEGASE